MRERKRNRLAGYDYSKDNLYFVTSCTQDRVYYFGVIKNGKMNLNKNGIIAQNDYERISNYIINNPPKWDGDMFFNKQLEVSSQ